MASEMLVLIVKFCLKRFLIFAQDIVDYSYSLSEDLDPWRVSEKVEVISYRVS